MEAGVDPLLEATGSLGANESRHSLLESDKSPLIVYKGLS